MQTVTHRIPGLVLTDHWFDVPLDHAEPVGEQTSVFAREVNTPDKAGQDLPWFVYFQGGPGFGSPRPDSNSGWLKRVLYDTSVTLYVDTGSPLTHGSGGSLIDLTDTQVAAAAVRERRAGPCEYRHTAGQAQRFSRVRGRVGGFRRFQPARQPDIAADHTRG